MITRTILPYSPGNMFPSIRGCWPHEFGDDSFAILEMKMSVAIMKPFPTSCFYSLWPSPVGQLLLIGDEHGLCGLHFQDGAHPLEIDEVWKKQRSSFTDVIKQLEHYFAGRLHTFTIPLSLRGTSFQLSVWQALTTVPYGETVSYGSIAKKIGNPKSSRAVGAANGQNPVSIIVPCHRVIGQNGKLVGYGGGLPIKKVLLDLEHHFIIPRPTQRVC